MNSCCLSALLVILLTFLFTGIAETDTYHSDASRAGIKCGTGRVLEQIRLGYLEIMNRKDRDTSVVSENGHFRVHYDLSGYHAPPSDDDDSNGIPDYIDSTLIYLEDAWDFQVEELGFLPPVSDNGLSGGNEIDVFITNFSNSYGQTVPDSYYGPTASSYMEIENDFAESIFSTHGYDALKVTTAHEFFHVIHFSYYFDRGYSFHWFMEQSAVWMEDRMYDDVNDYLAYLYLFFKNPQTSIDSNSGSYMYGSTLWAMYLAERFGEGIILDIWTQASELENGDIDNFDSIIPTGLAHSFAEFSVWNWFTEERANPIDFYHDSVLFPYTISSDIFAEKSPAADSLLTNPLTSRYIELLFAGDWLTADTLRLHVQPLENGEFVNSLVFYNDPYTYEIHTFEDTINDIPLELYWENAVLIISCTSTSGEEQSFSYETNVLSGGAEPLPVAFEVQGNYPNPFNAVTTLAFSMPDNGTVTITAYNAIGQKVDTVYKGQLDAGEKHILWKTPASLAGGVYYITIDTPWGTKTEKTALVK